MTQAPLDPSVLENVFTLAANEVRNERSLAPQLPLIFSLRGGPMTLENHFHFEPMFRTCLPERLIFKSGRQLGKTTCLAAQTVLQAISIPFFNTLFVLPGHEQVKRVSRLYVAKFMQNCTLIAMNPDAMKRLFRSRELAENIRQREFPNGSVVFFEFSGEESVDRIRGIPSDKIVIDEIQNVDDMMIPIIRETTSASRWAIEQFTGTPLSRANVIEKLWRLSSGGEWCIRCGCGYWNIPALDHDLERMLGPDRVTRTINRDSPGIVCAKCGNPISPRSGCWVHRRPDRVTTFPGYHISQPISPVHCEDDRKWRILLRKRREYSDVMHIFWNEVCGESADSSSQLVTVQDLRGAAVLPWRNALDEAVKRKHDYSLKVVSVDFGGGGVEGKSTTAIAVLGLNKEQKVDCLYGMRLGVSHNHAMEAAEVLRLANVFEAKYIVIEVTGAQSVRESFLIASGVPPQALVPVVYTPPSYGTLVRYVPFNVRNQQKAHLKVDKSRSLAMTCACIRYGWMRFFSLGANQDVVDTVLNDFLTLVEEKSARKTAGDLYIIRHDSMLGPDDFAHAVNIGLCWLLYYTKKWPDFAQHYVNLSLQTKLGMEDVTSYPEGGEVYGRTLDGIPNIVEEFNDYYGGMTYY